MTVDKNFKRKVRERMERTGERYAAARSAMEKGLPEPVKRVVAGVLPEPRMGFPKKQPW